jgi:ribosomal protein S18 acetylase RimI-like enzyme
MTAASTTPIAARLAGAELALRPAAPADMPFLQRVYGSTRAEELALTDWTDAQKDAFVAMQFAAQHAYYQEHYAEASFDVVLLDGQPAGRLYLARWAGEHRIVDIALLPEFRGRGLGSALLGAVMAEAARAALPVSIHVERFNPALRLYERLGFRVAEDKGVYLLMKWSPGS